MGAAGVGVPGRPAGGWLVRSPRGAWFSRFSPAGSVASAGGDCIAGSAGGVTVEAAFAIAALVAVLMLCVSGLTAVSMQVRCVDAAREAGRLAARGDDGSAAGA